MSVEIPAELWTKDGRVLGRGIVSETRAVFPDLFDSGLAEFIIPFRRGEPYGHALIVRGTPDRYVKKGNDAIADFPGPQDLRPWIT